MKNKDYENMEDTRVEETKVLNRPEGVDDEGGPEPKDKASKIRVRPKDKAQRDVVAAVAKARESGTVSSELSDEDIASIVTPVVDALYDAYEQDGTVATREAFAERCTSADVGNVVLGMRRDPFVAWRPNGKAAAAICAGCVLVVALVGFGVWMAVGGQTQAASETDTPVVATATQEDDEETYVISIGASADGWDAETSTPVIVHVVGEEQGVDLYHAYDANVGCTIEVPEGGEYQLSFISPVNADGSIYRVPEAQTVSAVTSDDDTASELPFTFELVAAEDVTEDELNAIIEQVTAAVENGDETLSGDTGTGILDAVKENCAANPNMTDDGEAESETTETDTGTSSEETTSQTGSSGSAGGSTSTGGSSSSSGSTGDSGSTSGSSSGNSGSSSTSTHTHNWVAVTTTVHHDAVYQTVHHDAVTEERHICNGCGQDITGNESAHAKAALLAGNTACGAWHSEVVTVQAAYDEQVLVSAAYDETVTTGYRCSVCGATK